MAIGDVPGKGRNIFAGNTRATLRTREKQMAAGVHQAVVDANQAVAEAIMKQAADNIWARAKNPTGELGSRTYWSDVKRLRGQLYQLRVRNNSKYALNIERRYRWLLDAAKAVSSRRGLAIAEKAMKKYVRTELRAAAKAKGGGKKL